MRRDRAESGCVALSALLVGCLWFCKPALGVVAPTTRYHGLVGNLEKVDTQAKRITVRTAEGYERGFSYGGTIAVHGLEGTAQAADLVGKVGSRVVVHYTGLPGRETAARVDVFGYDALKRTEGRLSEVDKSGRKVAVKTADGATETFEVAKDSALDTKHGIVDMVHYTGRAGDPVIIYHTQEGGRKVVRLLKHL